MPRSKLDKPRTTTPIRSKPFENRLDKRSHYMTSGNLKLYGKDKIAMRARIFERAKYRCEKTETLTVAGITETLRCYRIITEITGHWSHQPCIHIKAGSGHGQGFKCDHQECGIASCEDCHRREHGSY